MRWSQLHIPTLREDPADADAASHRLLLRAGFIRQLMAGHYSMLPLGIRVRTKVINVIREEMNRIGGQEFLLPCMQPAWIWEKSGRLETMGEEMFRLTDRKGAEVVLGMTHEEIFAYVATELSSYRELPQIWYHFQTKFRDEPRPKSGLLRVREFTMKDSYSFDVDEAGLDVSFLAHRGAYERIFARLGIPVIAVEASSGNMGGSDSVEFMCPSEAGEDYVAYCRACGYAANLEKATSTLPPVEDAAGPPAPERLPTPGVRTIDDPYRFDPWPRRFNAEEARGLATLDATPELLFRGEQEVLVERIGGNSDLDPFAAPGDDREDRQLGFSDPHIVLQLWHVFLCRPLFGERPGQHEFRFVIRPCAFDDAVQGGGHPAHDRMMHPLLYPDQGLTGVAFKPVPVEGFGDHPQLDDEVAGKVFRFDFTAFLAP